jgi:hypothetical protein
MTKYVPPKTLRQWVNDTSGGNLYELFVQDDGRVWSASGRYAHDSGATSCSWREFLDGKLDALVMRSLGADTLSEAKQYVAALL